MKPNESNWKQRLYDTYVSTGQARIGSSTLDSSLIPGLAAKFVLTHIPADKTIRIIDLGCGHGPILYFLLRSGYTNISGVDASQEQITAAHQLGIPQAVCGEINDHLAEIPDASVDVTLLVDVLEHMTRPQMFVVLDEVARVLKPGGKCIAHVPNAEGLHGMRIRHGDLTHEQAFTQLSAAQAFTAVGFRNITCHEDRPAVHGMKSLMRRLIWDVGTMPHRLLLAAETGLTGGFLLSQNIFIQATR